MNTYKKICGIIFILLIIFLAACGTESTSKENETIDESESVNAKKEETESEKTEENITLPELSIDEKREIINSLVEDLLNVYIEAGKKYQLADKPLTEDIYQSMAKDLKPYATAEMIENELYEIAQDFCYTGCDFYYFPSSTSNALRLTTYTRDNLVYVESVFPENELNGSYEDIISLAYENGKWKMHSFQRNAIDNLDLSTDEAGWILQENGYSVAQFLEEKEVDGQKVYVFELINNEHPIQISKESGYIVGYVPAFPDSPPSENTKSHVSNKEKYMQKLAALEEEFAWIDEYDFPSYAEHGEAEEQHYQAWDDMLNEIYGVIQDVLPAHEMEELRVIQREWITYRDTEAERGIDNFGGAWRWIQHTMNLTELTKTRCYELVENYL